MCLVLHLNGKMYLAHCMNYILKSFTDLCMVWEGVQEASVHVQGPSSICAAAFSDRHRRLPDTIARPKPSQPTLPSLPDNSYPSGKLCGESSVQMLFRFGVQHPDQIFPSSNPGTPSIQMLSCTDHKRLASMLHTLDGILRREVGIPCPLCRV